MDDLYLYEVFDTRHSVIGVLLSIECQGAIAQKIRPHEKVNAFKVREYKERFHNGELQSTPIILGVPFDDFDPTLAQLKTLRLSGTTPSKRSDVEVLDCFASGHCDYRYQITRLSFECEEELLKKLNAFPEFLLIDGHHRFDALRGLNRSISAWVVPISQLTLRSFIKIYKPTCCNTLLDHIKANFNVLGSQLFNSGDPNRQIKFFLQGRCYSIQAENAVSFIQLLNQFDDLLIHQKLELVSMVQHQDELLEHVQRKFFNHHLIVTHTPFRALELSQTDSLLPSHSTYFSPKPVENSLISISSTMMMTHVDL